MVVVVTAGGGDMVGHVLYPGRETRGATTCPTMHRVENSLAQNVTSAEAEKLI